MVVADSDPLIALARLCLLQFLPDYFEPVLVPDPVFRSVFTAGQEAQKYKIIGYEQNMAF